MLRTPRPTISAGPGRWGALAAAALFSAHALVAASVSSGFPPAAADLPVLDWLLRHRTAPLTWLLGGACTGSADTGSTRTSAHRPTAGSAPGRCEADTTDTTDTTKGNPR